MNADTYLRLSEQCDSIAEQVNVTLLDDQWDDHNPDTWSTDRTWYQRNLAAYDLRSAARRLREVAEEINRARNVKA